MNAMNTTNKKWYVLSFLSLILASMTGVHAADESDGARSSGNISSGSNRANVPSETQAKKEQEKLVISLSDQDCFRIFMDSNYLLCKYYEDKYYKDGSVDDKGTTAKQRKAMKSSAWESIYINKAKLSPDLAAAVQTKEKAHTKRKNEAGKEEDVTIEFAKASDVAKILVGLYRISDSKKEKKSKREKGVLKVQKYTSLNEAQGAGLKKMDYRRFLEVTSMHFRYNDGFGADYYNSKDTTLKDGFDKLMSQHYKNLIKDNPGKNSTRAHKNKKEALTKTLAKSMELRFEVDGLSVVDNNEMTRLQWNMETEADEIMSDRADASGDQYIAGILGGTLLGGAAVMANRWSNNEEAEDEGSSENESRKGKKRGKKRRK